MRRHGERPELIRWRLGGASEDMVLGTATKNDVSASAHIDRGSFSRQRLNYVWIEDAAAAKSWITRHPEVG